jgi:sugar lactone lactonase YvrE
MYFNYPNGIAWHERDQSILVADYYNQRIVRVPLQVRHAFVAPDVNLQPIAREE